MKQRAQRKRGGEQRDEEEGKEKRIKTKRRGGEERTQGRECARIRGGVWNRSREKGEDEERVIEKRERERRHDW